jgi:hypothetical protein
MLEKLNQDLQCAFKENTLKAEMSCTTYSQKQKVQIREALIFWEFVKWEFSKDENAEYRISFLNQFVNNANRYIALVAKIEMLPTKVWRKLLWRENIDFLSLESFLRRIFFRENAYQVKAIGQNWSDLYRKNQRARVLTQRFWDKIGVWLDAMLKWLLNISDENTNPFGGNERYLSKGAWAYNLASLDFGFAKYPEGADDDTRELNPRLKKFFSLKSHLNDFSTNDEDGTYWFFYQFVRSFGFIWRPEKVKLTQWVCPGFWTTLIGFFVFLLLPILALVFLPILGIWALLIASPNIAWLSLWTISLFLCFCTRLTMILFKAIVKKSKLLKRYFLLMVASVGVIAIGAILWFLGEALQWLSLIIGNALSWLWMSFPLWFSIPLGVVCILVLGLLFFQIPRIRRYNETIESIAKSHWLKNIFLMFLGLISFATVYYFQTEIYSALQISFLAIWEWLKDLRHWLWFLLIPAGICFVQGAKISCKNDDEQYRQRERGILYSLIGIILDGTFLIYSFPILFDELGRFGYILLDILTVFLSFCFVMLLYFVTLTTDKILDKKRKRQIGDVCKDYEDVDLPKRTLLRWVKTKNLDTNNMKYELHKLWNFAGETFSYLPMYRDTLFQFLSENILSIKSELLLDDASSIGDNLQEIQWDNRSRALLLYLQGMPWEEIRLKIEKEEEEEKAKKLEKQEDEKQTEEAIKSLKIWIVSSWLWQGIVKLVFWLSRPFLWLWLGLVWVGGIIADLKKLNDLFHKVCPRNEPRRAL